MEDFLENVVYNLFKDFVNCFANAHFLGYENTLPWFLFNLYLKLLVVNVFSKRDMNQIMSEDSLELN